jgi:hypothetical protein
MRVLLLVATSFWSVFSPALPPKFLVGLFVFVLFLETRSQERDLWGWPQTLNPPASVS